jgi:hypothetical protein
MAMVGSYSTTPRIEKSDFLWGIFFLKPAIDKGPGALSIATFKKKSHTGSRIFQFEFAASFVVG